MIAAGFKPLWADKKYRDCSVGEHVRLAIQSSDILIANISRKDGTQVWPDNPAMHVSLAPPLLDGLFGVHDQIEHSLL